jgi:hypothetical protein
MHARVFISCGQSKGSDEVEIAHRIAERLSRDGFEPYIAVEEQTIAGLTENIFGRLRNCEYFIFVDFKRERLGDTAVHRGSLFAHQELAIAAFSNIDALIAFQETRVNPDDGMMRFLQANANPFTDRNNLPSFIADEVRQRGWISNWRNELVLERDATESTDAPIGLDANGRPVVARFFHIKLHNRHREKLATNCFAYLERATQLPSTEIPLKTVEFKWAGVQIPGVAIAASSAREFDALFILHEDPLQVQVNTFSDSPDYRPRFPAGAADYELSYVVRSENFPPARATFRLQLRKELAHTTLS